MTTRRIAYANISLNILSDLLFPEGTAIRDAQFDYVSETVQFVVQHPDLEEVPDGAIPASVVATHARIEKGWIQ